MADVPSFVPPPPAPPLGPPPEPVAKVGFIERLGPRADRRPEPRLGVTMAAAGAALAVVGAIALGGDRLAGSSGAKGSQYPGLAISLIVVVLGAALTAVHRNGPLAAAGVAASATALVPLAFFLTYSDTPSLSGSPISFGTILLLSSVGWTLGYLVGPGRGHAFFLGAALLGSWLWVLEVTEHVFSFPTQLIFGFFSTASFGDVGSSSSPFGTLGNGPSPETIGVYTLVFAGAYLVAAGMLDRRDHRGVATPFTFAGVITLIEGISLFADDLKQAGTGFAFLVAGLGLAYLGATAGRRLTNWVGGILVFGGTTAIVAEPFDTITSFAIAEMVAGAAVVIAAHIIATTLHEPAEVDPVLSRFYSAGSVQPSGPPPPPAGSVLG
jgi:hypothetical protein